MSRRILIDPVTRIEGHAKITVDLDDDGAVRQARLHVTEFRGFESFCVGRPVWEMPVLTARICGICPVSHLLASAKATDAILAVRIPELADKLRRLMNLAQIVQSHALSFFHLASPDLFLGYDAPVAERNLAGMLAREKELALGGIRLRQYGQSIIEALGGKKIHPAWALPGGVRSGLTAEQRESLLASWPAALRVAELGLQRFREAASRLEPFGDEPGLFLGLVGRDGRWEHYEGVLRILDTRTGATTDLDASVYESWMAEECVDWSYLKFPYYRPYGFPTGSYRVGPLARLNLCSSTGYPRSDAYLKEFRHRNASFYYHEARLIEIVAALEAVHELLAGDLASGALRANASVNQNRGVGCSEAPRGTLFHHYEVDDDGRLTRVNLVIATGQNNYAMNQALTEVARRYVTGPEVPEPVLNRLEAALRAFDPCLSCSTHAAGKMPIELEVRDLRGNVLGRKTR